MRSVVAPGTVPDTTPDREPVAGEILLSLDTTSGCSGSWAGCGGPRLYTYRRADRATVVNGGRIWVQPFATAYTTAQQRHLVAHELGHALGLDHYDGSYGGQVQVMHPSSYDAESYRSGDANGLAFLAQRPPVATTRSFDGDGRADLIVADPGAAQFAVALSNGARLNGAGWWLSGWGGRPDFGDLGDFDGDGKADLIVGSQATATYSVATSTGSVFGGPGPLAFAACPTPSRQRTAGAPARRSSCCTASPTRGARGSWCCPSWSATTTCSR